jgi:hypothetical protein
MVWPTLISPCGDRDATLSKKTEGMTTRFIIRRTSVVGQMDVRGDADVRLEGADYNACGRLKKTATENL